MQKKSKIQLVDFNNLTKSLTFNIYDVCYAQTQEDKKAYFAYIDDVFNADHLTEIMRNVTQIIGAEILNIAQQDYEPHGASSTILVAEGALTPTQENTSETPGPKAETVVAHLDKSHIAAHTYPESHPHNGICSFRADIDVSTCGLISPLKALNYLIHSFESDIVAIDYRVRGFTRDVSGKKHYMDHEMHSIQNYFPEEIQSRYTMTDMNIQQENIFHTKMIREQFDVSHYLFNAHPGDFSAEQLQDIERLIRHEMMEIYYGRNFA